MEERGDKGEGRWRMRGDGEKGGGGEERGGGRREVEEKGGGDGI